MGTAIRWALAAGLLGVAGFALYIYTQFPGFPTEEPERRYSTTVFGAPFRVEPGASVPPKELRARLERLGYRETQAEPAEPAEVRIASDTWTLWLRGHDQPFWPMPPQPVRLFWEGERITRIVPADVDGGFPMPGFYLEPEVVADLSGSVRQRKQHFAYGEIPPRLVQAVVAIEDRRFLEHRGVSGRGTLRAALSILRSGRFSQGGSTITQQLAKNLYLSPKKTITRKVTEWFFAAYLESVYDKEEIFTLYANTAYLGQQGSTSIIGFKSAARFFFDKMFDESTLSLGECAMLAGLLKSPYLFNPFRDLESATRRRDTVLKAMLDQGYITEREFDEARAEPLEVAAHHVEKNGGAYRYFVSELQRRLLKTYDEHDLQTAGMTIYTTMDPYLQDLAQAEVAKAEHEAALVALEAETGRVRALVGGRDFATSPFNRATQALRQPGSTFKPFVYGAAMADAAAKRDGVYTARTVLRDELRTYRTPERDWTPANFEDIYRGTVTVREALANSINAPTVDLASRLGAGAILRYAKKLGIDSELRPNLGLALGVSEVRLIDLVGAYAAFANGGWRVEPYLIEGVLDRHGAVEARFEPKREHAISPGEAFLMTSLLKGVIDTGTGRRARWMGLKVPAAGKTGTTQEERDAWFLGFTPYLVAGVWVGEDQPVSIHKTGSQAALPVWARFMVGAHGTRDLPDWEPPPDVMSKTISDQDGLLWKEGCGNPVDEYFLVGTAPTKTCEKAKEDKSWLRNLLGL